MELRVLISKNDVTEGKIKDFFCSPNDRWSLISCSTMVFRIIGEEDYMTEGLKAFTFFVAKITEGSLIVSRYVVGMFFR
jgi:hypothetical protein